MLKRFLAVSFLLVSFCLFDNTVVAGGGSRGASSSSGGRSYSSGGKSYSSGSSSSSGSKSYSSGGGKSYSSGAKATTTPSVSPSSSGSKSYSSGNKTSYSSGSSYQSSGSLSSKPKTNYDSSAAAAQQRVESKKVYQQGNEVKNSYKTSKGDTKKIDAQDKKIQSLRTELTHERWVNRDLRAQQFYNSYWTRPAPVVVYNDPFNNFFWWWMLDQSLETRAMWAYQNRETMDQQRLKDLYAKDAQLEARVKELEAQKIKKDESYTPPGVDKDLMYTDEYVDAVYNPAKPKSTYLGPSGAAVAGFFKTIFVIFLVGCFVWFVIWIIFVKEW